MPRCDGNPIVPLHSSEPKTWTNHFVCGGGSLENKGTAKQSHAAHELFIALQPLGICCVVSLGLHQCLGKEGACDCTGL